jgi:hypothetical protein
MNLKGILLMGILFSLVGVLPVSGALQVTCDKGFYSVLSNFEAICQVNTTDNVDINVVYPTLVPNLDASILVLDNISNTASVPDLSWGLDNITCESDVWSLVNITNSTYYCPTSNITLKCIGLIDGNSTCQYNTTIISGYHDETTYNVDYASSQTERLGDNQFRAKGINSVFDSTYFKIVSSIPIGSIGKFSIDVNTSTDSGNLDPEWYSDWKYRKCINIWKPNIGILYNFTTNITLDTKALITAGHMDSQGKSIRVLEGQNGRELKWEWDDYAYSMGGTNTTIWVKLNNLTSSNYTVCVYYKTNTTGLGFGNSTNTTKVWNTSVYSMIWHFANANGVAKDSIRGINLDDPTYPLKTDPNSWVDGIWGRGIGGYYQNGIGYSTKLAGTPNTNILGAMAWYYPTVQINGVTSKWLVGEYPPWVFVADQNSNPARGEGGVNFDMVAGVWQGSGDTSSKALYHLNSWTHILGMHNATGSYIFLNGTRYSFRSVGALTQNNAKVLIGVRLTNKADEIRVMYRKIPYNWIKAAYGVSSLTGAEEAQPIVGYPIEFTKFTGGKDNITLPTNQTTSFFVAPNATYSVVSIDITGLPSSAYPLNPKVYVAEQLVWSYTGNYSSTTTVNINASIINAWLVYHPSGEIPVTFTAKNTAHMLLDNLYVKGISTKPVTYCDGTQYYDPISNTCRLGTVTISSQKDKNYYSFRTSATTSNWYSTDPFKWERENQSKPVTITVDFKVPNHILNVNETNARRVSIDFNKISQYTKYDIWTSITVRKDFYINIMGDNVNDYVFVGIPAPREVFKDMVSYYGWTYDSTTKTLTILNVPMSPHHFYLTFSNRVSLGGFSAVFIALLMSVGYILILLRELFNVSDGKDMVDKMIFAVIGAFILAAGIGIVFAVIV